MIVFVACSLFFLLRLSPFVVYWKWKPRASFSAVDSKESHCLPLFTCRSFYGAFVLHFRSVFFFSFQHFGFHLLYIDCFSSVNVNSYDSFDTKCAGYWIVKNVFYCSFSCNFRTFSTAHQGMYWIIISYEYLHKMSNGFHHLWMMWFYKQKHI